MRTLFINTQKEARIAQTIARRYGWERPQKYFYKKYLCNLFTGYQNFDDTRNMCRQIDSAIYSSRER